MLPEGRRQKAEGRRQKAEGRRQKAEDKLEYSFCNCKICFINYGGVIIAQLRRLLLLSFTGILIILATCSKQKTSGMVEIMGVGRMMNGAILQLFVWEKYTLFSPLLKHVS